ncbi:transmembrane protein 131-like isoform X2 [Acanthaster planci]|uniref:Transmembrane protein 131-like isoform X2 n=1 Tax=Acanthaster planci TaxID=133434 RepID=A0A8B7Z679_ACAPL|nr:transmembrane protein 131-like isoform X2 [Acanthaster planci]
MMSAVITNMAVFGRTELHSNGMAHMWLTLALSILQLLPTHLDTVKAHGQAFVQTDFSELPHFVEEVTLNKGDLTNQGLNTHDKNSVKTLGLGLYKQWDLDLSLQPPMLDFGEHAIGMPELATVQVFNSHPENMLRMLSISGSTPHFHCSFFQDKVVPPGGNTTFEIVFLPRVAGNAENTIFIHTSAGTCPYQVFGVGVPNPYRLRPFVGAKVPINTSYSPLITMHNPYSSGLMVTEMYSSGGELHLELPTGSQDAPQNLWEIPPYTTRSVMRASFTGRVESNHTAFIRIKTNHSKRLDDEENELLMLPVEVEVSSAPGIYSSLEMLDFGTLRSLDSPKTLPLYLINTSPKSVQILSITSMRVNNALTIDFKPLVLKPSDTHTKVAEVTFHPLKANTSRLWSGKLIVKTKDKNIKLQIPYQAHVLQGTLSSDQQSKLFYLTPTLVESAETVVRPVALTNYFNFTLVIHQVSFPEDVKNIFKVTGFNEALIIQPQTTDSSLSIVFSPNTSTTSLQTFLRLGSNASVFSMGIHVYTGKLKYSVHSVDDKNIDLGVMSVGDHRSMLITLVNTNPIDVPIQSFSCNLDDCEAQVLGVEPGEGKLLTKQHDAFSIRRKSLVINEHHFAVLRLEVKAPLTEGQFLGSVVIETPHERVSISAKLRTVEGCLGVKPEHVIFRPAFPGTTQSVSLMLVNSFSHRMKLESILPDPPDKRFYYRLPKKTPVVEIEPHRKQKVGRIVFDPKAACGEDDSCYVGLSTQSLDGEVWLSSLALPDETQDVDKLFYNHLHNRWQSLEQTGKTIFNATLKVNSNLVKDKELPVTAVLEWPRLIRKDKIEFPLTYIENSSISEVQILNPSDTLILVQLLPVALYQDPTSVLDFLTDRFDPELIETDDPSVFFLANNTDKDSSEKCLKNSSCGVIEETFGVRPNRTALTVPIKPHQNVTVAIGFKPSDGRERISLILIRNNLTILDAFMVRGRGARGELRFNSKMPSPNSNLLFELKPTHLEDCDRSSPKARVPPNFTVKRSFTLKNTGQLPIYIKTFSINGYDCNGYGFKVLQCRPMELVPNETKRLDIAFTPDFTMSRITRQLKVLTYNQEELEYTLIATLPPHMLSTCAAALPRPQWEHLLYIISVILMGVLFLGILTASYLEALRLTEPMPATQPGPPEEKGEMGRLKCFDLRSIAAGIKIGGGGGGASGGGGAKPSSTSSVLSTLGEKLSFRPKRSSSPSTSTRGSTSSVANNTRHSEPKSQSERRLSPDKDKVKVNSWANGSVPAKQSNALNTSNSSTPSPSEAAPNRRSTGKARRRPVDSEWNSNYANNTSSSRENSNRHPEHPSPRSFVEDISPAMVQDPPAHEAQDSLEVNTSVNKLARNSKRKSNRPTTTSKREEHDKKMTGSKRKEEMMREAVDRDDSSSISTECSNPESEPSDKSGKQTFHQADSEPSWPSNKSKSKALSSGGMGLDDFKFEDVKSRTKPRKNAKMDPAFYGDVCRPSTLELPYVPHGEAGRRVKQNSKEPTSPHSIAAKIAAKATKKALKTAKPEQATKSIDGASETASTPSSEVDKDSPPPLWEQVKPMPSSQGRQLPVQAKHPEQPTPAALTTTNTSNSHRGKGSSSKNSSTKSSQFPETAAAATAAAAAAGNASGRPSSYSKAVAGAVPGTNSETSPAPEESTKKTKLAKTKSMPEKTSAFTAVGDIAGRPGAIGSKGISPKTRTWPWTGQSGQPEMLDSASDTSSTASTGPSSPGMFSMPSASQPETKKPMSADSYSSASSKFPFANHGTNFPATFWDNSVREPSMDIPPPPMSGYNPQEVQQPKAQSIKGTIGDWLGLGVGMPSTSNNLWQLGPTYPDAGWSTETGSPRSPGQTANFYPATSNPWSFEDLPPPPAAQSPNSSWNSSSELFPSSIWSNPSSTNTSLLDTTTPSMATQESPYSPFSSFRSLWGNPFSAMGNSGSSWSPGNNDQKQ